MIPRDYITEWRREAPWVQDFQVEQDLIISKALVYIFSDPLLNQSLAFRGGTALYKLFLKPPLRYSEDIDLVQIDAGPAGELMDALRDALNRWLGKPNWKQTEGRVTFVYRFDSEDSPPVPLKPKVEMTIEKFDVAVIGAGIVGISTALHLQARSRSVVVIDRRGPGEEASYGNIGLIERATIYPPAFPQKLADILRYASNKTLEARYHLSHLPEILPWLLSYWWHSRPKQHNQAMRHTLPLMERSVAEHEGLAEAAGSIALFSRNGWMKLARTEKCLDSLTADVHKLEDFGLSCKTLTREEIRRHEPYVADEFVGGVKYPDPVPVSDPGALVKSYANLFLKRGGMIYQGDARYVEESGEHWIVTLPERSVQSNSLVIAMGGWSDELCRRFGYRIPLATKRGYHLNFERNGDATLGTPIADVDRGYAMAPMEQGIRVSSGIEFASKFASPTPVQIKLASTIARNIFPLGNQIESEPWIGLRPCLPDMLPVMGPAPRHRNLWFNFGHGHHGFTLGPAYGRLVAEYMTGQEPFTDPSPYLARRFS